MDLVRVPVPFALIWGVGVEDDMIATQQFKLPTQATAITGIVTDENVDECYKIFKKNKIKVSTICNVSSIDNHVINGDLITLQLNEGVIYMGQIEEDLDTVDKYKYV